MTEALFGCTKEFININGQLTNVEIKPGLSEGEKLIEKNKGFINTENNNVGNLIINLKIKIPDGSKLSNENKEIVKQILNYN